MNIIALQFDIVWENKSANFAVVERLLTNAAPEKDTLLALPEMFATGFSMNTASVAEAYGGDTEQFLARMARQFGIYIVAGAAMRAPNGRVRNKALVLSPDGELIAFYAKIKPFAPGGETEHHVAGTHPIVFDWSRCNVSPFICYDLRFPELFRIAAAKYRPQLFVVLANWPDKRIHHWTRLLQARAIENQAYVMGVNRIGQDPLHRYSGHSVIVDPHGEILADLGESEGTIQKPLDLAGLAKYRAGLPFLEDLERKRG